jgi:hypothetical protein
MKGEEDIPVLDRSVVIIMAATTTTTTDED